MTEKGSNNHEEFLHEEEFFVEKNEKGELISVKRKLDFDEFPNAINLDESQKEEHDEKLEDEKPIGETPTGKPLYEGDDPGEMYKLVSILEQTPKKDQHHLKDGTLVEKTTTDGKYRRGFTQKEVLVKRVLDENGNQITKKGMPEYKALIDFEYGYREGSKWNHFTMKSGESFFSPKGSEKKKNIKNPKN